VQKTVTKKHFCCFNFGMEGVLFMIQSLGTAAAAWCGATAEAAITVMLMAN